MSFRPSPRLAARPSLFLALAAAASSLALAVWSAQSSIALGNPDGEATGGAEGGQETTSILDTPVSSLTVGLWTAGLMLATTAIVVLVAYRRIRRDDRG